MLSLFSHVYKFSLVSSFLMIQVVYLCTASEKSEGRGEVTQLKHQCAILFCFCSTINFINTYS